MFSLNFGRKKVLGIDIGSSAIKIAELELKNNKPLLSNYAWMPMPAKSGMDETDGSVFFRVNLPEYIKKIIKKSGMSAKEAYVAIPAAGSLITLIDFPRMPSRDMEQAIRFEAHKYIPTSLDEVVLSWEIIDEEAGQENEKKDKIQVLLVASSKNKIITYEKAVKKAGLKLKGIEIENISMVNSLIGNDKGKFIIVDIGSHVCNIIYAEKGTIRANRNIDAGGYDFIRTIAKSMGVTEERAEMLMKSGKNFFTRESGFHFSALDMIVNEVSRILEIISQKTKNSHVEAIILSGGTANLKGLHEFFQNTFNIKTITGNPFSRVSYDKKLENSISRIQCQFSVCLGLALSGIQKYIKEKK